MSPYTHNSECHDRGSRVLKRNFESGDRLLVGFIGVCLRGTTIDCLSEKLSVTAFPVVCLGV